jgi:hypothetical protein
MASMRDVNKALSDILEIRSRIAAGTAFRGYGPLAIAATGLIALTTSILQSLIAGPSLAPAVFVWTWLAAALLSAAVVRVEMQGRSRRLHSGLADAMINQAIEHFLPAAVAALALPIFLLRFSPQTLWMMPGLWQILVSLGIFASLRSLPGIVAWSGGWYFLSGFLCLLLAGRDQALSPWLMGLPFFGGQMLTAAILHFSTGDGDGED